MKKEKKKKNTHLYESPSHNKYDTGKRKQEKTPDKPNECKRHEKKEKKYGVTFYSCF